MSLAVTVGLLASSAPGDAAVALRSSLGPARLLYLIAMRPAVRGPPHIALERVRPRPAPPVREPASSAAAKKARKTNLQRVSSKPSPAPEPTLPLPPAGKIGCDLGDGVILGEGEEIYCHLSKRDLEWRKPEGK